MDDDRLKNSMEALFSDFSPLEPESEEDQESAPTEVGEPSPDLDSELLSALGERVEGDIKKWRKQLIDGALRILLLISGLAVVIGAYSAYRSGQLWLVPVYVIAYMGLSVVTFWPRVSYDVQVGTLLAVLYGLGGVDLFTAGRSGGGHLYLLAFSLAAPFFLGYRRGLLAFGLSLFTLVGVGGAYSAGLIDQTLVEAGDAVAWVITGLVFLLLGALLLLLQTYLVPRMADALSRSQQLAQELETHQSQLEERTCVLRRRVTQMEAGFEVGRAITSIFDVDQLVRKTVDLLCERLDVYFASIFLLDESGEWVDLKAAGGESGSALMAKGLRLPVAETSMVGWTALHRRVRIAENVEEDTVHQPHPLLSEVASEVTLPLIVGEQIVGVLDVQSDRVAAFDATDVQVLQSLADQIAVAIQNARRISNRISLLEATRPMYKVSRRLTTATTPAEVADAVVSSVVDTEADGCLVVAFEHSPGGSPEALHYLDVWRRDRTPQFQPGVRLPISESPFPLDLVSSFWAVSDVREDDRLPNSAKQVFETTGVRALVNIPLRTHGRVIGQVVVLRDASGPFSESALRLYEALSDQASVALERARLLEDARQRAEREQQTRRVVDRIRRSATIERALQTTAEELSRVMKVPQVSIELNLEGDGGSAAGRNERVDARLR